MEKPDMHTLHHSAYFHAQSLSECIAEMCLMSFKDLDGEKNKVMFFIRRFIPSTYSVWQLAKDLQK